MMERRTDVQAAREPEVPQWWLAISIYADPALYHKLVEVIEPAALREWLSRENAAFSGECPINLLRRGELEPLEIMAHRLRTGEPH